MKIVAARYLCMFLSVSFASCLQGNGENTNRNSRRHLLESGTECVTYLRITDVTDGPDEEAWTCEFTNDVAKQFGGARMVEIEGLTTGEMKKKHAVSGGSVLRLGSSSYVETEIVKDLSFKSVNIRGSDSEIDRLAGPPVLHISADDDFVIEEMDEVTDPRHSNYRRRMREERRRLAKSTGDLNTLVIRVVDKNGVAPSTTQQLDDDIFRDGVSLKTQFGKCSHNNINIVPSEKDGFSTTVGGTKYDGIIDVEIPTRASRTDSYDMVNTAISLAEDDLLGDNEYIWNNFDLVMICQPQGTYKGSSDNTGWLAYAWVNYHISVYNDEWCNSVSAQMHEIGHNLGLLHSGIRGVREYADTSGMMGYSYNYDDIPAMCFNAAKSFQLGWYPDQMLSVNPLALPGCSQQYTLNGVVDYGESDGFVTIRLEHEGDKEDGIDYYLGFNRKTDFNFQTQRDGDMVQIVEKVNENARSDRNGPGQSWLMKSLNAGEEFAWDIGGTTVNLKVDTISGKDAVVTLTADSDSCQPTPEQTPAPTPSPTVCEDSPRFKDRASRKKAKSCTFYASKNRCNNLVESEGKFIWELCPVACNICDLPAPTPSPTPPPGPVCEDGPAFKDRASRKKAQSCTFYASKNRCNNLVESEGKFIWELCPVACNTCDSL